MNKLLFDCTDEGLRAPASDEILYFYRRRLVVRYESLAAMARGDRA